MTVRELDPQEHWRSVAEPLETRSKGLDVVERVPVESPADVARPMDELARVLEDIGALHRVSSLLIREGGDGELYEAILRAALSIMRADCSSMEIFHRDNHELYVSAARDAGAPSAANWRKVSEATGTLCASALRTGRRLTVPDVHAVEFLSGSPALTAFDGNGITSFQATPLMARDGRLFGVISTYWCHRYQPSDREDGLFDVLARQVADWMVRVQFEVGLREVQQRQTYLFELSEKIRAISDPNDLMSTASRLLGERLGVNRTLYVDVVDEEMALVKTGHALGVAPVIGTSFSPLFALTDSLILRIMAGEVIDVADVATDPGLTETGRARLLNHQVGAAMAVGLLRDGKWVGALVVHNATPRTWTAADRAILQETADRVWLAFERIEATAARRNIEASLQAAIEATTDAVFISDTEGRFVHFNEAFATFHRFPNKSACAKHLSEYLPLFDAYLADGTLASPDQWAVPRALRGERQTSIEYGIRRRDTGEQWVGSYSFSPIRDTMGRITGCVVVGRDISAQKQTERELSLQRDKQKYLLSLSDALAPLCEPGPIMFVAAGLLGEHLHANRVLYLTIDDDDRASIRSEYARGVAALAGGSYPAPFALEAGVLADIKHGGETMIEDVATDARITESGRARLQGQEVGAAMASFLVKGGKWVGAVIVQNAVPRKWTPADRSLLAETADRTWAALERARAEAARHEIEQRYAALFDQSPVPTTLTRATDSVRVAANAAFAQLFELGSDDVLGKNGVDQGLYTAEALAESRRTRPMECAARTRSGKPLTVVVDQIPVTLGRDNFYLTTLRDMTAQRQAEAVLREREQTLGILLATAAQGILSVDTQGQILTANRAVEAMFGWESGALVGQPLEVLLPTHLRHGHVAKRAAYLAAPHARPMGTGRDLVGQRKDGTTIAVEVSLSYVATPTGGVTFAFISDITARKTADLALREQAAQLAQRTRQLGRLTAELTLAEQRAREQLSKTLHDGLQQLLFSSTITLDRARKRLKGDAVTGKLLATVRQDLDDAVACARSLALELFPRALHDGGLVPAIQWLASWMRERYGLAVELRIDASISVQRKEARILLFESIRELLFNAVKHAKVDRVDVVVARDNGSDVRVEVTDCGVGFDPTALADRGDLHHVGTGLLTIQERLLVLGGRMEVNSVPGNGTRFCLTLPCSEAPNLQLGSAGGEQVTDA